MPHVEELVLGLDGREHVDAAVARGLHERREADLAEQLPQLQRDGHRLGEARAGLRVEVDAQLVGVVGVPGARRPRVEDDRVHLRGPDRPGRLVDARAADACARSGR